MTETKREPVRMPAFEDLDDYEKELCQSADPADHTALLMRIALKGIGIDPDGDDWYVSGHKMESSDPNLVIEEQKLYYKPVVKKVHVLDPDKDRSFAPAHMKGSLVCTGIDWGTDDGDEAVVTHCAIKWPKYQSLNHYTIKGRGTVFTVVMDDWLRDRIENGRKLKGQYVEIDGEAYILKGVEFSKGLSLGDIAGLQVMKMPLAEDMRTDEQRRIDKSVRDDADTASMEELEAAGDIYDELMMREHSSTNRGEDDEEHEG